MNARLLGALAGAVLLTACTGAPAPAAAPAPPPEPPAPPAACLLDTQALRVATGLAWTADATTATDARCVYDPDGGGAEFVVVDVAPGPATPLDEVAALCTDGSRTPAGAGFACRLAGGGVFAATERDGELVTFAAAAVPAATTADRLATALTEQLTLIG